MCCKNITKYVISLRSDHTSYPVHVISFKKLREYFSKETNAKVALQDWYKKANKAEYDSFTDSKHTFNLADSVGNGKFVFKLKGNHY